MYDVYIIGKITLKNPIKTGIIPKKKSDIFNMSNAKKYEY